MSRQFICKGCSKPLLKKQGWTRVDGDLRKLCRLCGAPVGYQGGAQNEDILGIVESFVKFTQDYGYIIGFVSVSWIFYASLHR